MKGTAPSSTVIGETPRFFGGIGPNMVVGYPRLSSLDPDSDYIRTFKIKDSAEVGRSVGTGTRDSLSGAVGACEGAPYRVDIINILRFGFGSFIGSVLAGLFLFAIAAPGEAIVAASGLSLIWLGFAAALGSLLVLGFRMERFLVPPFLLVILLISSIGLAALVLVSAVS